MCSVTGKQTTAMTELAHAATLKGIHADPLQRKLTFVTEHGFDTRNHPFRLFLFFGVGIPPELKINAIHIVGLAME